MKTYAVIDMKTKWILFVSSDKDVARARLKAYINGVAEAGSVAALAPWVSPEMLASGETPRLAIAQVESGAKARAVYTGEILSGAVSPSLRRKAG